MRKASRTLNWYFCLRSIVRVCCEMVKKKKNNEADTHLFYSFHKKMYKMSLKSACDVDFGCQMKALLC